LSQSSRFELAPPRHFLLPAVLLLLSEEPSYGYNLVKEVDAFRFGRVDRPAVYRALALLERDGMVESWSETPKPGQARRVYGLTERGRKALRAWMGVIKEERDCLDAVLRRYQATGATDAVLAEVEGGWGAVLGRAWSSMSSTSPGYRRARPRPVHRSSALDPSDLAQRAPQHLARAPALATRFRVVPERSALLIEARSTVGPITFGLIGLTGEVEASVVDGVIRERPKPVAHVEAAVSELRSGNNLYDAELLRRIGARRFPTVSIDLRDTVAIGSGDRYRLTGEINFHGAVRPVSGTVTASPEGDKLLISGEEAFDIRDFDIESPTVLMLRIYPDVRVHLHLEAALAP
jgi:DNA-binding PadR family transcriptional regulator